jgi:DNA-directed RNA polymerase specialized sigma24 family protein
VISENILEVRSWKNSLNDCERDYIAQVLEKLPEDSRIVIFLHYWRDIELGDIAEVLGVRLKEVEFIHNMTLRLLSKVFGQKLNEQRRQSEEVAA